MLRISKLADYGTVAMVYLAKCERELSNARDIALHTHLSLPTISKILKRLTAAGLLVSVRGVTGGYRLQRLASEISVASIIYALEDERGLTECSADESVCALQGVCHVQGNWRLISQAIESALQSVSLEALARPTMHSSDVRALGQVAMGVSRVD